MFAFCSGGTTIGYFAALDPAEALEEGLRAALLRLQSTYGSAAEPLPDRLRGSWRGGSAPAAEAAVEAATVAARLRARGRVAVAVDHRSGGDVVPLRAEEPPP
ncbi:hypothetical protein GCM10022224_102870 [Nonomuraea antimicrobica]|uniref:Uncharacterized protein n=1 Tax=Nonomuraea antimicrobica TaxID=561173 RepID=A0ABP7EM21_9ACTN